MAPCGFLILAQIGLGIVEMTLNSLENKEKEKKYLVEGITLEQSSKHPSQCYSYLNTNNNIQKEE